MQLVGAPLEVAEVAESLEKMSQHDGNLWMKPPGEPGARMGCKDLILAYPLPATNGSTAPSRRPSSMRLRAHFLALKWAKITTLVHMNYQASQSEKYIRHDRHVPSCCDQPHRADTDDNLQHLPSESLHYQNHCHQHSALEHQNQAAERFLDQSPRGHPEGQKLHHQHAAQTQSNRPHELERRAQTETLEKPLAQDPVMAEIEEVH